MVWVGGLGVWEMLDFDIFYVGFSDVSFMFAGALNRFVWCSGTSKADFFDGGFMELASKAPRNQTC